MKAEEIEKVFCGHNDHERRFTQDFPVLPWLTELLDPDTPLPDRPAVRIPGAAARKTEGIPGRPACSLSRRRAIDWDLLEPFLHVPHHPDTTEENR